jgi:DNA adenine methylase
MQSPIKWTGGKARIAKKIISAFPSPASYDVFCEVFAGSASILFAKQPSKHLEVINDRNARLINFWMAVREDAEYLQWKLRTLPYSETLFKRYKESLDNNEQLEMVEAAARWYYVNRGTIAGHIDSSKGWSYTGPQSKINYSVPSDAVGYQNAIEVLNLISQRLGRVQIHDWSYERVIEKYQSPRTLLYLDPPYLDTENYYAVDGTPPFTLDDHRCLAALLNQTPAKVALSYYEHPLLDELYPPSQWRRLTWQTNKESSRMNKSLQSVHEVLLMNYEQPVSLWDATGSEVA